MTTLDIILKHIKNKHVYIQTHNFPDPDAIASAFGLQQLLASKGITSSICHYGQIDSYSTNKMIECLGIEITNVDINSYSTSADEIILVDSQKGNSNIKDLPGDEIICLDHHPAFGNTNYRFSDIRPELGACASMIAEYFIENQITIDKNTATALLYGIKIDTANLTRGVSELDLKMFYTLYGLSDVKLLECLDHATIKLSDLKSYANAINTIKVFGDISFANAGAGCPEPLIASISDFMLDLAEVNFSVIYSYKDEGVKLSVRSSKDLYDSGQITKAALEGFGRGGGHPAMAGGFIPYTRDDNMDSMIPFILEMRFLKAISDHSPS
ncbi:MAG: DHH family phosphoesterase [Lachnospiraceae bacterium]|nr:DHH family phosphoesterase [Lachnospiraceae bacterium]